METKNNRLAGGGLKRQSLFDKLISVKNLLLAWEKFKEGKNKKSDVIKG